jgi:predicted HicB family RNase H-like nuclease
VGRPRKGARVRLVTRVPIVVAAAVVRQAREQHLSVSEWLALHLRDTVSAIDADGH